MSATPRGSGFYSRPTTLSTDEVTELAAQGEDFNPFRPQQGRNRGTENRESVFSHDTGHIYRPNENLYDGEFRRLTDDEAGYHPLAGSSRFNSSRGHARGDSCHQSLDFKYSCNASRATKTLAGSHCSAKDKSRMN